LRYVNGYDTYLMQTITTEQTTGAYVQLPDAYMMIAADVNMNDKVRANDITLVQERIVKKITEYPQVWNSAPNLYSNSLDWLYIDKHTVDTDPSFARSTAYPNVSGVGFYRDDVPNVPFCLPIKNQCKNDPKELYSGILLGDLFDGGPTASSGVQAYPIAGSDPYIRMSTTDKKVGQSSPVTFEIDDITPLGNNVYRVFVKHTLDSKDTLVSLDFAIDYNEKVLSIVDLQQTATCKGANANMMWNDADNSELILTSYASSILPSTATLFYIDVYKSSGVPAIEDFGTMSAFINGSEVSASANLRSGSVSGVTESLSESSVSIVPNPSIDIAVITYSLSATDNSGKIEIVNSLGQLVKSFDGLSANGSIQLDVSTLSKGIYYCVVISGDKKIIKKLVVS
ncbi:MAG TPA: T9SS type A sorting domain-containing protein, partial [Cytophagaceae bacterium]|nr:T9SS type A sorting domain-containing protein [Cytophagaceae bacterium]